MESYIVSDCWRVRCQECSRKQKYFFTCKKIIPVIGHKSCRTPAGSWSRRNFPFYPVLVLTDDVTRTLWVDGTDNYKSRHRCQQIVNELIHTMPVTSTFDIRQCGTDLSDSKVIGKLAGIIIIHPH